MPRPHLHMPRPHLHVPSSPVPVMVGAVARWRARRADMSLERRRARTMVGAAVVFVCVVLLTSFPLSGVLSQRSALSGTAHQLATVQAQNEALARQVSALADPATVDGLARHDYGFVPEGQRAYDILPSSSPSGSELPGSGQVPLNGPPVVPGSARSQALIGIVAPAGSAERLGRDRRRRGRGLPARAGHRAAQLLGTGGPEPGVLELIPPPRPLGESDREAVTRLLGRSPSGEFTVAVRRRDGTPAVIDNAPLLDDGRPMPTRYWLVDAELRDAVSRLEAAGGVRRAEAAVDPDELADAHARHGAERDRALPVGHSGPRPSGGVGGTRQGVKCLHAHLAWTLAGGDDPVGRWTVGELGLDVSDFVVEPEPGG